MAKYTAEQAETVKTMYRDMHPEKGNDCLEEIAKTLGAGYTVGSVRAKLVREGLYVTPEKPKAEPRPVGPTKAEIREAIEANGFETEGFESATRDALLRLSEFVASHKS